MTTPARAEPFAKHWKDTTMLDLDPMKDRVSKATPGPWGRVQDDDGDCFVYTPVGPISVGPDDGVRGSFDLADADLIAHAPTDLADLIAEVETLRDGLAGQREALTIMHRHACDRADESAALAAQVKRVRELHKPGETVENIEGKEVIECSHGPCFGSDDWQWPCATIRALEGGGDAE